MLNYKQCLCEMFHVTMQDMKYQLYALVLFTDYCTFVGYWLVLLQRNDGTLAHGGVLC